MDVNVSQQGAQNGLVATNIDGDGNDGAVTQTGIANGAIVTVNGDNNQFDIVQDSGGATNTATLNQDGENNQATLEQDGDRNTSEITQFGNGMNVTVEQFGPGEGPMPLGAPPAPSGG
ncbi:MAG: hypothetical protein AAFX08_04825 [Pseudomonadota bacterium]